MIKPIFLFAQEVQYLHGNWTCSHTAYCNKCFAKVTRQNETAKECMKNCPLCRAEPAATPRTMKAPPSYLPSIEKEREAQLLFVTKIMSAADFFK